MNDSLSNKAELHCTLGNKSWTLIFFLSYHIYYDPVFPAACYSLKYFKYKNSTAPIERGLKAMQEKKMKTTVML